MTRHALAALALGGTLFLAQTSAALSETPNPSTQTTPQRLERYHQAITADPGNLTLHYLLGVTLLKQDDNAAALHEFQLAYPAYRDSIEAHYNLGIAAYRTGDLDSAQLYMEQAEALGATESPEIYPLGNFYFNLALQAKETGRLDEAATLFQKAFFLQPERKEIYRLLGDLYAQQGKDEMARQNFKDYLKYVPGDPISREYLFALEFNRAQDALAQEDLSLAEAGFQQALEIQPESPTVRYYLGYLAYSQGNPVKAVSILTEVYPNAEPSLQEAIRPLLYNCSLNLRKTGHLKLASETLTPLVAHNSASFDELFFAGTLALDLKDFVTAQPLLERAVALQPGDVGALQSLIVAEQGAFRAWLATGRQELAAGNLLAAREALQAAAALQPDNQQVANLNTEGVQRIETAAATHFKAAGAAVEAADYRYAEQRLRQGLQLQPDNNEALILQQSIIAGLTSELKELLILANQQLAAEDWSNAEHSFANVLSIDPGNQEAQPGLQTVRSGRAQSINNLLIAGRADLDRGDLESAEASFNKALELAPNESAAHEGLTAINELRQNRLVELLQKGRRARDRGDFDQARQWFDQAALQDRTNQAQQELADLEQLRHDKADALVAKADLSVTSGHFKEAETLYARVLQILPQHERALRGRGSLQQRKDDAVQRSLETGNRALQAEDYATAMVAYRAVLDLTPGNQDALAGMMECRNQGSDSLEKLLSAADDALASGDLQTAREQLDQALQKDPFHKKALQIKQRLDQLTLTGANPGDEQQLYLQGVSYYTQGRYAEAIQTWEAVLALDPTHAKARQNIEKTQRKLKQIEEYRSG